MDSDNILKKEIDGLNEELVKVKMEYNNLQAYNTSLIESVNKIEDGRKISVISIITLGVFIIISIMIVLVMISNNVSNETILRKIPLCDVKIKQFKRRLAVGIGSATITS